MAYAYESRSSSQSKQTKESVAKQITLPFSTQDIDLESHKRTQKAILSYHTNLKGKCKFQNYNV